MFGLPTFPKLILIAAVIAVVWYFWRRAQVTRRAPDANLGGNGRPTQSSRASKNQKPIEDMVQCKSCGAYVPAKTTCSCGQAAH